MKDSIDKFVSLNYQKLLNIAKSKIDRFDRSYSPEELVSEAYIYVVKNQPKRESDIPKYMVNFMNIEVVGQNSNTNRALSVNSQDALIDCSYEILHDLEMSDQVEQLKKKMCRELQILFEVVFDKGHTRIKEIAAHLDLTMSQAYLARKELLTEIQKHYESKKGV
jgi:hypothetical protein